MNIDEKFIAEETAKSFWEYQYPDMDNLPDLGYNEFSGKLSSELLTAKTETFRLFFLVKVGELIEKQFKTHLEEDCTEVNNPDNCPENIFYKKAKYSVDEEIKSLNPNYDRGDVLGDLTNKSLLTLKDYLPALKQFQIALTLFDEGGNDRTVKDTLRLCLELFLKEKLKNTKSLEKQIPEIGTLLKNTFTSK